jgi:hypothetical protein
VEHARLVRPIGEREEALAPGIGDRRPLRTVASSWANAFQVRSPQCAANPRSDPATSDRNHRPLSASANASSARCSQMPSPASARSKRYVARESRPSAEASAGAVDGALASASTRPACTAAWIACVVQQPAIRSIVRARASSLMAR